MEKLLAAKELPSHVWENSEYFPENVYLPGIYFNSPEFGRNFYARDKAGNILKDKEGNKIINDWRDIYVTGFCPDFVEISSKHLGKDRWCGISFLLSKSLLSDYLVRTGQEGYKYFNLHLLKRERKFSRGNYDYLVVGDQLEVAMATSLQPQVEGGIIRWYVEMGGELYELELLEWSPKEYSAKRYWDFLARQFSDILYGKQKPWNLCDAENPVVYHYEDSLVEDAFVRARATLIQFCRDNYIEVDWGVEAEEKDITLASYVEQTARAAIQAAARKKRGIFANASVKQ